MKRDYPSSAEHGHKAAVATPAHIVHEPRSANGWMLIATLTHRPGRSTMVQVHRPDAVLDTEAWARSDSWCECCHIRRSRRTTYLLRHVDGRLTQVGSSCLTRLIGQQARPGTPHSSIRPTASFQPRSARPRHHEDVETLAYLAHVAQVVIDFGFVRAGSRDRETPATWTLADESLGHGWVPSDRADRRAQDALAWVRNELPVRTELDDFEQRLVGALSQDHLERRQLPTAAAAIYAYHQHLRRLIAARKKAGRHIGAPGATLVVVLTVQRIERIATATGPMRRHFLSDDLGRQAIWDSRDAELPLGSQRLQITIGEDAGEDRALTVLRLCAVAR